MPLAPQDWHARYQQQARWTQTLRAYLYERAGLSLARRVLEVGCGTGVLLPELSSRAQAGIFGLDIQAASLRLAGQNSPAANLTQGDTQSLPFSSDYFDLAVCHFVLLWVTDPLAAVKEMRRVTRPGGAVLALAEPDYGGRIDYPSVLAVLGDWQTLALEMSGANPRLGRRLGELFAGAGLSQVEIGVLGGQWSGLPEQTDWELEWQVLQADLQALNPPSGAQGERTGRPDAADPPDAGQLERLRYLDRTAWQRGERVLFVPTFYAWGRVS